MNLHRALIQFLILAIVGMTGLGGRPAQAANPRQPNIIFIFTDDLGYGDVGAFFQNQRRAQANQTEPWHMTPHLDTFAAQGMQLRDHYCGAPVCAPSRASLLTGVTQGHAVVRDNQFDKALADNHTLASVLKGAGYATAAFGKWGLQGKGPKDSTDWPAHPLRRGFDYYYGYIRHIDGHFHYPKEDGIEVYENETNVAAGLDRCYTTDLFAARAKQWIVDQKQTHPDQPFFVYLAFDTPHAKLQNPPSPYPAGGGLDGGVQWTGQPGQMINTATGTVDGYMHPDYANATWDHDNNPATAPMPWPDVNRRYANLVRRIDDTVGDLLKLLADLDVDDQTLIVFSSDNGPSRESYLKGEDANGFSYEYSPEFFNSFGPFDGIKRDTWEGGVRVPTMARWPGRIAPGSISARPSGTWDWMATFADIAGMTAPARTDGVSLVPTLTGQGTPIPSRVYIEYNMPSQRTPNYPEFTAGHRNRQRKQMQTIRQDDYVGVRYDIQTAEDDFEIYNVVEDPQETRNLALQPEFASLQQTMKAAALRGRMPDQSAPRPYDATPVSALTVENTNPGILWQAYRGDWSWLPKFDFMTPVASGQTPRPDLAILPADPARGLLFSGLLRAPKTGEYTFTVTSDGPSFLRIHDCQVVDGDFGHAVNGSVSGTIVLQAGVHPFRLYYSHRAEPGSTPPLLTFEWAGPGIDRQPVPAAALSHPAAAPERP